MNRRTLLALSASLLGGVVLTRRPQFASLAFEPSIPRARQLYELRMARAQYWATAYTDGELGPVFTNANEVAYPNGSASFTKTLPHDDNGYVDPNAYKAYFDALRTGTSDAFEAIPMGGTVRLVSPMAAYNMALEGADSQSFRVPSPPAVDSEETAGEIAELYWAQVLRDVSFANLPESRDAELAASELRTFATFEGTTPANLYRAPFPGVTTGPYISQFLYLDIPFGSMKVAQHDYWAAPGLDYLTDQVSFLANQRGVKPSVLPSPARESRYLQTGRDLAAWVQRDFPFQLGLNAALILMSLGREAFSDTHPYRASLSQDPFVTFGAPMILGALGRVSQLALDAAWYQKWLMHRRIRPEAYAAAIDATIQGRPPFTVHPSILNSKVVGRLQSSRGSAHLGQAYTDGAPAHPSYPGGHAAFSGACVTVLKAFFKEDFAIPKPMIPSVDGQSLVPYAGRLTVGGELNKLASNVAIGRNIAGVHYRSDAMAGMRLGEQVAIGLLHDLRATLPETFDGFRFTSFDGSEVVVA